jgi:hypothetical protein
VCSIIIINRIFIHVRGLHVNIGVITGGGLRGHMPPHFLQAQWQLLFLMIIIINWSAKKLPVHGVITDEMDVHEVKRY